MKCKGYIDPGNNSLSYPPPGESCIFNKFAKKLFRGFRSGIVFYYDCSFELASLFIVR